MQDIPASAKTLRPVDLRNSDSEACAGYRNFPILVDQKAAAEACCILSGISARKFLAASADAPRTIALSAGKLP